jgi:hypothetical protein
MTWGQQNDDAERILRPMPGDRHEGPIRPRTKDERRALLVGYAMALEMVIESGVVAAQTWLKTMMEAEGIPTNERSTIEK